VLLTITPELDLPGNRVTFLGTDPSSDRLYLRVVGGLLEYSTDGTDYTNQLDPQGHVLPVNSSTLITAEIGTAPTYLTGMGSGGGQYQSTQGSIEVTANLTTQGADLALTSDDITVDPGVSVSTASTTAAGGNLAMTVSSSGFLRSAATALAINIGASAQLLTQGATGDGAITLTASNTSTVIDNLVINPISSDVYPQEATITIGASAAIRGGTVSIGATSGEESLTDLANPYVLGLAIKNIANLFGPLASLPLSVVVTSTIAKVEVGSGASIDSSGAVDLSSVATGLASGTGIYYGPSGGLGGLSFAYMSAATDAETTVDSGAQITTSSDVDVTSSATGNASATARVTQNTGVFPTNINNIQVSVSSAQVNTTSHAFVDQGATIQAGGNVVVKATGKQTDKSSTSTSSYFDGRVGLTAALGFDDSDIRAYVDGTIRAGARPVGTVQVFNPFTQVDFAASEILLPPSNGAALDYQTGEGLVYSSGLGGPIGGLEDGTEYYAILVPNNPDAIRLAATPQDAAAGQYLAFTQYPTVIDATSGITLPITDIFTTEADTTEIDFTTPVPFADGDPLVYHAVAGQLINGLEDGQTYYATLDASDNTKLGLAATPGGPLLTLGQNPVFTSPDGSASYQVETIDTDASTFTLLATPTGLENGSPLVYHAALGSDITGLVDGQTYYAIYDPNNPLNLQLAANLNDAVVANPAVQNQDPTLTWVDGEGQTQTLVINTVDSTNHELLFDAPPDIPQGQVVTYIATPYHGIGGLTGGATYTVAFDPENPNALELTDAAGNQVPIEAIPTLMADGQPLSIRVIDSVQAQITLAEVPATPLSNGESIVYHAALGTFIGSLVDGDTYVVVNYNPADPTVLQLADPANPDVPLDLAGAVELGDDNSGYMSGDQHTLTPDAEEGILVEATLTSADSGKTTSGQGGEPKLLDVLSKGELLPAFASSFTNILSLGDPTTNNPVSENIKASANGTNTSLNFAGSFVFQQIVNSDVAEVGPDAVLTSDGDLAVEAPLVEKPQSIAEASISKPDNTGSSLAVAAAIVVALYDNTAHATIDGGAHVDARNSVAVTSSITYPFVYQFQNPNGPFSPSEFFGKGGISNITAFLDLKTGLTSLLINSFARSVAKNPNGTVSVSGSVDYTSYDDDSEATIGAGAMINQNPTYQSAAQSVAVDSTTTLNVINVSGIADLTLNPDRLVKAVRTRDPLQTFNPVATTAKGGVGGSFVVLYIKNTNTALIEKDAQVHSGTDGLSVASDTELFELSLAQSGATSTSFGVSGSMSNVDDDAVTTARIASGVGYAGGSVAVNATDNSTLVTTAGSIQKGNFIAFGISVAINDVNRTTDALIGDPGTADAASSFDIMGGDLTINAIQEGTLTSVSLAAVAVSQAPAMPDDPTNRNAALPALAAGVTYKFGIDASGAVTWNEVTDHVEAAINDLGNFVNVHDVALSGTNQTILYVGAGAVTIAPNQPALGFAGGFGLTTLEGSTLVFIAGATVSAQTLELTAERSGDMITVTAGAAAVPRWDGYSVAGSASIDTIDDETRAYLAGAVVMLAGAAMIRANDDSYLYAIAGSVAYGGYRGFGAAITDSEITTDTEASIEDSTVTQAGGGLAVDASDTNADPSMPRIIAITGSGAVSNTGVALSGTGSVNLIDDTVQAFIAGSTVTDAATGNDVVHAEDDSWIISAGGAVGKGQTTSVGFGVGYNSIDNVIAAYLDNAAVTTGGALTVHAKSDATISTASVGIGVNTGTGGLAGSGSASVNLITDTVDAHVANQSSVTAGGPVQITADDDSEIVSVSGAAAAATASTAIAAAVSYNLIANTIEAYGDGSAIDAAGAPLTVTASAAPLLVGIALGGAGAQTYAFGGSVTVNSIADTLKAYINNSTLVAGGDVTVSAGKSASMFVFSGALVFGSSNSVGASLAYNYMGGSFDPNNPDAIDENSTVTNQIDASISGSSVTTPGAVTVAAGFSPPATTPDPSGALGALTPVELPSTPTTQVYTATVAGSGAQTFALGAGVSLNFLRNSESASIADTPANSMIAAGAVTVATSDSSTILSIAGGIAISGQVAAGAAVATNDIANTVAADVAGATVDAAGTFTVAAISSSVIDNITAGAAAGSGVSLTGSVSVNSIANTTEASVSGGSAVEAGGNVAVTAEDESVIAVLAGNVGVSSTVAAAAASATNTIANNVWAYVNGSSVSSTTGGIAITATFAAPTDLPGGLGDQIEALAVSGSGAGSASLAGSLSLNWIKNDVEAYITQIGAGQSVTADAGTLDVAATDESSIESAAGTISGAAAGAFGASLAYNYIGGDPSDTTATGMSKVLAYIRNAISGSVKANVIEVDATASPAINTLSVAGSAAGTFILGGSLSINFIRDDVEAFVLNSNGVDSLGNLFLVADDAATIDALSGLIAGSGGVGIGLAGAYNNIANVIEADSDGSATNSGGNFEVQALSAATIVAKAAGIAVAGKAFGGSASINLIGDTVSAFLNDTALDAGGSFYLLANSDDAITSYGGTISGAATGSVGGAVVVNTLTTDTEAYDHDSTVSASAQGSPITVKKWLTDPAGTEQDETIKGLAVVASNTVEINVIAATGSIAGAVGVGANLVVNTVRDTTKAYLDHPQIVSGEDIIVRAHQATTISSGGGVLAGGGALAVAFVVDSDIVTNTTQAFVNGANLTDGTGSTAGDVDVDAISRAAVTSITAGLAGSIVVAFAGGASGVKLANVTQAYIGNGSIVDATGGLTVLADDGVSVTPYDGFLGTGGAVGLGGAVAVALLGDVTTADITSATTNAAGPTSVQAHSAEVVAPVAATLAASGGVGLGGSTAVVLLDGTTAASINSSMVNQNAAYAGGTGQSVTVDADDSVDETDGVGTLAAGVVLAGIGAGADVVTDKNAVDAHIADSQVTAALGQVNVSATSAKDIASYAFAFAFGNSFGISGAVSVLSIGTGLDSAAQSQVLDMAPDVNTNISLANGVEGLDTQSSAEDTPVNETALLAQETTQTDSQTIDGALSSSDEVSPSPEAQGRDAADQAAIEAALNGATSTPTALTAFIGAGSSVYGAGGVDVIATNTTQLHAVDGGGTGALLVSFGGSVGYVAIGGASQAFVDDGATVGAGPRGEIDVLATTTEGPADPAHPVVEAYTGQGGTVGLGAQVAIITDASSQRAFIGNTSAATLGAAQVTGGREVTVAATATRTFAATGTGGTFGAGAAVGVSEAAVTVSGDTLASIGQLARIAADPGQHVGGLAVTATATNTLTTDVSGLSISVLAGVIGGESETAFTGNVQAYTDTGALIDVDGTGNNGDVSVTASSTTTGGSTTDGIAGGLVVGYGEMTATATTEEGDTEADLSGLGSLTVAGNLSVHAVETDTLTADATAGTGGVVGIAGADSVASATPSVTASVSAAGLDPLTVQGTADVASFALGNPAAIATGSAYGLAGVGTSEATASWLPTVASDIGGGTMLTTTTGDIDVRALNNYSDDPGNPLATEQPANLAFSDATASGGGAASIISATANSSSEANVDAHIMPGAVLAAGGDLNVVAESSNKVHAAALGRSNGIVGIGSDVATGMLGSTVYAVTDRAVAANPTVLTAGGVIQFFAAASNNGADSDDPASSEYDSAGVKATGGAGGLYGQGGAAATITLINPITAAAFLGYTAVLAPDADLEIVAQNVDDLKSASMQTVSGAVASNESDATTQIMGSQTLAGVGSGSTITVKALTISATDTAITELASTNARVPFNLGGTNYADSQVLGQTSAEADVFGATTKISATSAVTITAATTVTNTVSHAVTSTTGLTGILKSNAANDQQNVSRVHTDPGSTINTSSLTVNALRPSPANDHYVKIAQTNANTVTQIISQVIGVACEVVGQVICLWGALCNPQMVCQSIVRTFEIILGATADQTTPGRENVENTVDFNSNVTIGEPTAAPVLKVNAQGQIVQEYDISASIVDGQIVVDPAVNPDVGTLEINAPLGQTTGSSLVTFNVAYPSVTIDNASPMNVMLHEISVYDSFDPPTIDNNAAMGFTNWTYTLTTNAGNSIIDVENTNPAGGDILIGGPINNPIGVTTLHSMAGSILWVAGATGGSPMIVTRMLDLVATNGTIGTAANPLAIALPLDPNDATGIGAAEGEAGVYLDLSARSTMEVSAFKFYLGNIQSTDGNIDIQVEDGSIENVTSAWEVTLLDGSTVTGQLIDDTFDPATAVANNEITMSFDHQYVDGELVTYQPGLDANGNPALPIGGLTPNTPYSVITIDPLTIKLGSLFDAAANVDPATGTINLPQSQGYQSGNPLVYQSSGGTAIGGLVSGRTYYVRVIDAHTIKLAATPAEATQAPLAFTTTDVVENSTFNLGYSTGFTSGQAVVYTTQGTAIGGLTSGQTYYVIPISDQSFELSATVDSNGLPGAPITLDPSVATGLQAIGPAAGNQAPYTFMALSSVDTATSTIDFGEPNGFSDGEALVYRSTGASMGGLTSGNIYYAVLVDPTTIGLSAAPPVPLNAIAATGIQTLSPVSGQGAISFSATAATVDSAAATIDFGTADGFTTGEAVVYQTSGTPIGGLESGQTYYVVVINSNTISLLPSSLIPLDPSTATGTQTLGFEGIPITPGTGIQSLIVPLNPSVATGTAQRLTVDSTFVQTATTVARIPNAEIENQGPAFIAGYTPVSSYVVVTGNITSGTGDVSLAVGTTEAIETDLYFQGLVSSPEGTTTVSAMGSIYDNTGSTSLHIAAVTASLTAAFGIGESTLPVKLQVATLIASAGSLQTGGVFVQNSGDLTTLGISAAGSIVVNVRPSATTTGSLILGAGTSIASTHGSVRLLAAGNISVPAGTSVKGGATVLLESGLVMGGPRVMSSTVDVSGTFQAGTVVLQGFAVNNTIEASNDASFSLSNTSLARYIGGILDVLFRLLGFDNAQLTGGPSNEAFDVSGWTGMGTLDGGGGMNTIIETDDVNYTLSDTQLSRSGRGTLTLVRFQQAHLTGGASNDTFDVSGWTGSGTLDGGGGTNTVIASNDVNFTLSNSSLGRSGLGTLTLANIQIANLTGGGGNNTFTVSGWTGNDNLDGGGGADDYNISLVGSGAGLTTVTNSGNSGTGDLVTVTGARPASVYNVRPSQLMSGSERVQLLQTATGLKVVGLGSDTYNVYDTVNPTIITGGGNDSVTIQAAHAPVTVNTGNSSAFSIGSAVSLLNGIQAPITIAGDGTDVVNLYDTADGAATAGTLTATTLSGIGMGPAGVVNYSGLLKLDSYLGHGANSLTITGNSATSTYFDGGPSRASTVTSNFAGDFSNRLTLDQFGTDNLSVGGDFQGTMVLGPTGGGLLSSATIAGSMTSSSTLQTDFVLGSVTVGENLAGSFLANQSLNSLQVSGAVTRTGAIQAGNVNQIVIGPAPEQPAPGSDLAGLVMAHSINLMSIGGNLTGIVSCPLIRTLYIGGNQTASGAVVGGQIGSMKVGGDLAGTVTLSGSLTALSVAGNLAGVVSESGLMSSLAIGGSLTPSGSVSLATSGGNLGDLDTLSVGHDLAGNVAMTGRLARGFVGHNFTGSVSESGTINVFDIGGSFGKTGRIKAIDHVRPRQGTVKRLHVGKGPVRGKIVVSGKRAHVIVARDESPTARAAFTVARLDAKLVDAVFSAPGVPRSLDARRPGGRHSDD
jgi:hypothetical protein